MSLEREYPRPPFPQPAIPMPGRTAAMQPRPDHGETTYRGSGRLQGRRALITGGDSGIGRAVAIAYAREGADVAISYLDEEEDAIETARWVEEAGRRCVRMAGDIAQPAHCRELVRRTLADLGGIDILVNNAAFQKSFESLEDISEADWDRTFATNISAMFHLTKAAVPNMPRGSAIINTASINADSPNAHLLAYATTKGAIENFSGGLAQLLADKGIRVNSVAPGPVWTPLIPSTLPEEKVRNFGQQVPFKRPAQPAELAPVYVLLASPEASYVSGAMVAVTGGRPII